MGIDADVTAQKDSEDAAAAKRSSVRALEVQGETFAGDAYDREAERVRRRMEWKTALNDADDKQDKLIKDYSLTEPPDYVPYS